MPQEQALIEQSTINIATDTLTDEPPRTSVRQRRLRFLLMTIGVTCLISYLIYSGMRDTMGYYLTVTELLAQPQSAQEHLRVSGQVQEGSVTWEPGTRMLQFTMIDDAQKTVPVTYHGIVPDSFKQGQKVIVEGTYAEGRFTAKQLMTPCASKYE